MGQHVCDKTALQLQLKNYKGDASSPEWDLTRWADVWFELGRRGGGVDDKNRRVTAMDCYKKALWGYPLHFKTWVALAKLMSGEERILLDINISMLLEAIEEANTKLPYNSIA